jgi:transcription elongation factor Elf1
MLLNMDKKTSVRFHCPGCERNNFRSLKRVRNHFQKKRHSLQCPVCEKTFKDELAVIQHYQNYYTKFKSASPVRPNDVQQIPSPSVLPSAVVTPVVQSIPAHRYVPEEPFIPSEQELEIRGAQLIHDLLASMPALNIKDGPILGKESRIY